jgi:hypothetical protein
VLKAPSEESPGGAQEERGADSWDFMPSPQIAAVAVMALLAAGVILGSVTNPLAQGANASSIIVEVVEPDSSEGEAEEPVAEASAPIAKAPAYAPPSEVPLAAPEELPAEAEAAPPPAKLPPELPEEETLPEIKHVFLIALDGHDYEEAFGPESPAPYLSQTLAKEGELLAEYHPLAEGELGERIAPLGERLTAAKLSWKEYVEPPMGEEEDPAGEERDDLDRLAADLSEPTTTPAFSYILPNSCHDGAETPCAPEQPTGLAAADGFLETVVPEVESSPAFEEEGGLLAITFDRGPGEIDQAPEEVVQAPEEAVQEAEGPPVGMLLISPYVDAEAVDETGHYDHLSFLRTVEELFGLESPPPEDGTEPPIGFPPTVFDASPEESTVAGRPQSSSGKKR